MSTIKEALAKAAADKAQREEIANCEYCKKIAAEGGFGPSHFASPNCQSGRRPHCSCDLCF